MKKKVCVAFAVLFVMAMRVGMDKAQAPSDKPVVVKLDPALDELISTDAKLEVVKTGFGHTEGPNWVQHGKTGYLLLSDIPANVIDKITPDGKVSVFLERSGYAGPWNGFTMLNVGGLDNNGKDPKDPLFRQFVTIGANGSTLDPQGRLVVCTFGGRSVVRIEKNGKRTVLADSYEGKQLVGPNDVVVKKDGAIYFTDARYSTTLYGGVRGSEHPQEELPLAIYMIKDGKLTVAIKDIPTPNGLAFSPDEKYLYANGSRANYIRRYDVQPDDTLTNSRLLIDLSGDKAPGITDGMRVDSKGDIYSTGPGGVWIISPEGKHLGTILTPEKAANLTFGDPDWKTVYIAAKPTIYKIRVNTPGLPCNSCSLK